MAVSEEEEIMWISLHKLQDDAKMAELLYIKWEGGWIRTVGADVADHVEGGEGV